MAKILVIDDCAVVRQPIAAALIQKGYEARSAADGAAGLGILAEFKPDLIILDVGMPIMDGLTFLKLLRARREFARLPVIMLTADSRKPTVVEAVRGGVREYLLKSHFSLDDLFEKVTRLLNQAGTPIPRAAATPPAAGMAARTASAAVATVNASGQTPATPTSAGVALVPHQPAATATTPLPGASAAASTGAGVAPAAHTSPSADESPPTSTLTADPDSPFGPLLNLDDIKSFEEIKPLLTRTQIKELIDQAAELRAFSPTVAVLLKLTSNPRCTIDQIVRAVGRDHALALKLLKLANSSAYARGEPVDSVRQAILRIGLRELRQAVLNIGVVEHFSATDLGAYMDIRLFWEHSIGTALIASHLATATNAVDSESAFTMGLLHDAGRLVLHELLGAHYDQTLPLSRKLDISLERVEGRLFLLNHADVMDRILHTWKFPASLVNPIVFHHLSAGSIRGQAPRELAQVALLGLANRLAHALLLGDSGNLVIYPINDLLQLLNLDDGIIADIEKQIHEQTTDMKLVLVQAASGQSWPVVSHTLIEGCPVPLKPAYVGTQPATDTFRIFCDQIADLADLDQPNLIVSYIHDSRDRSRISELLLKAESENQWPKLPLLMLSSKAHLKLDDRILADRKWATATTPALAGRLVRCMSELVAQ
ncbi:MAG: HDOD domain-containing protein [Phycisphaeraceae bacterium]|nr:HDOD domain-containing protein [Phycisphaeraceae bacterium]